jgi:hypothetical protein
MNLVYVYSWNLEDRQLHHVEDFGKKNWIQVMTSDNFSNFLPNLWHFMNFHDHVMTLTTLGDDILMTQWPSVKTFLWPWWPWWKSCDDPCYDLSLPCDYPSWWQFEPCDIIDKWRHFGCRVTTKVTTTDATFMTQCTTKIQPWWPYW